MRTNQIDEVLEAFDSFFRQLGAKGGYAEAARLVESATGGGEGQNRTAVINIGMTVASEFFRASKADSERGFQEAITNAKDYPTPDQLRKKLEADPDLTAADYLVLEKLRKLPRALKGGLTEVQRRIIPKGGHPFLVPRCEYAKICDEITSHLRSGDTIGEAKRKVAKKYGCTISTIHPIWRKRGESPGKDA